MNVEDWLAEAARIEAEGQAKNPAPDQWPGLPTTTERSTP